MKVPRSSHQNFVRTVLTRWVPSAAVGVLAAQAFLYRTHADDLPVDTSVSEDQLPPIEANTAPPPPLDPPAPSTAALAAEKPAATPAPTPSPAAVDKPAIAAKPEVAEIKAEEVKPGPSATPTDAAPQAIAESVSVPETSPPAEDTRAEATHSDLRHGRILKYTLTRPNWGIEIAGSASALGGKDLTAGQSGAATRAVSISTEFQPAFLQSVGVIGIGPHVGIYPISSDAGITNSPASLWAVGGQIRYQARFFREQPIVPFGGFEMQYLNYSFSSGPQGTLTLSGPMFGALFLLNFLEPTAAAEIYINQGISRSYLVAEFQSLTGADSSVLISGQSLFFGLRFEF